MTTLVLVCALIPAVMVVVNWTIFAVPEPAARPPRMSVLIPARDEEANIGAACASVLGNEGVELELIVLDDHSTDATAGIVRAIADPRVRLETAPPLPPGWAGKAHACWVLARLARHELLVFVDADVRLAPDALRRVAGFMEREPVAMGSGFPAEITRSWAEALLLPLIHYLLLGFLPMPAARWLKSPAFGAGCGQLVAAWRRDYERVGGHAGAPRTLHDGITLARTFRRGGCLTGVFDASRIARCRMYDSTRGVFSGLAKNATEGMATPIGLPVWTVLLGAGQVLPVWLATSAPSPASFALLGLALAPRLALARRFRQPLWSAVLHPLGIAVLLAIQWWALLRGALGRPATWRGRSYAPG